MNRKDHTRAANKHAIKYGAVCLLVVTVVALGVWYFASRYGGWETLPEDMESTRNLMLDIFQVAQVKARAARATDVIVASEVVVQNLDDLKQLPLNTRPTNNNPVVYNFRLMFMGKEPRLGDPQDSQLNLLIKPLIAWPTWSANAQSVAVPVLLVHPDDGYRMGAKASRIKWMTYKEVQALIALPDREIDRSEWPYYRVEEVRKRLEALR